MSNDITYHINCDKCGGAFWSKNPNNLGDELCDSCKRIKELESAIQEYIETQQLHFPDCDIVTNSAHFREQFKQLLEK